MQARRRRSDLVLTTDQKKIVWHIRTNGPVARTQLAGELGMHNASLTRLARELIMLGCLDEHDDHIPGRGRPSIPLRLTGRAGYSAGAMAHPGWLELVLVDFAGEVLVRHSEPFNSPDPRVFAELIGERLKQLSSASALMQLRFLGLGIAIAGNVVDADSTNRWTVKWLEGWRRIEYPTYFEDILGFPVWVENESTLAGLADFYDNGLMMRHGSAISVFVGHGVGGSIIYRHDVISGEYGNAGDIGRLFPSLDEPRPSGIDLVRDLNASGAGIISLHEVGDALLSHTEVAEAWIARASDQLLTLAASGAAWVDPGAILVTGSIPIAMLDKIAERMRAAPWIFGEAPKPIPSIHATRLGSWAVPLGAALLPIHEVIAITR